MDYAKFVSQKYRVGTTYRSVSEAFRDADYATPIWRCETENEKGIRFLKAMATVVAIIYIFYFMSLGFFTIG